MSQDVGFHRFYCICKCVSGITEDIFKTFSHNALSFTLFGMADILDFRSTQFGFNQVCSILWEKAFYSYSLRDVCWRMFCGSGHLGFSIHTTEHCKWLSIYSLGLIMFVGSEKIIYFPIGSYVKTLCCSGSHFGFPIDKKKT